MRFSRVIIYCQNAVTCASFYQTHFGLHQIGEWSSEWAEVADESGMSIAFHQAYIDGKPVTHPTGSPMNPHKLVFTVADVAQERQKLVETGVSMGEIHHFEDLDNLVFCDGSDPEGHRFQLCNR